MSALIYFDVQHLYYLPQYLPAARALERRGAECRYAFYRTDETAALLERVVRAEGLNADWVSSVAEAVALYRDRRPRWVVFGNSFAGLTDLPGATRSALLYHGIGVKDCYYDADLAQMNVRFVEGPYRAQEIRRRYPQANVESVGFAKLDPLFGPRQSVPSLDLAAVALDPRKRTVLYAPTFFPSSIELMADDWPAAFGDFNLLVKPHFFTMNNPRYAAQRRKIERWARAPNVYVANDGDYSLLPFMASADLLISEASSALFEFAALDRPVLWCDFLKLRWTYRGPLRFRFERRMDRTILQYRDVGAHVERYSDLLEAARRQLSHPQQFQSQRRRYTEQLIGVTDGCAGQRIADYLLAGTE